MSRRRTRVTTESCAAYCAVDELTDIVTFPAGGLFLTPKNDLNKVWPHIYIGDESSAKNTYQCKCLGITDVLNVALGKTAFHVNTNHVYYRRAGIAWLGIKATDTINCDIAHFFSKTTAFIQQSLQSGGSVLVHCRQGLSRSATVVIAYLMICSKLTVQEAVRTVRAHREINPNPGFLQQLCDLNESLWKQGHFEKDTPETTITGQKHNDSDKETVTHEQGEQQAQSHMGTVTKEQQEQSDIGTVTQEQKQQQEQSDKGTVTKGLQEHTDKEQKQ